MSEFELRQRLRDLRVARDTARDLWPGIAARLRTTQQRPARHWIPFAMAAGLAAAALGLGLQFRAAAPGGDAGVAAIAVAPWTLGEARALRADYDGALTQALGREHRAVARELVAPDLVAAETVLDAAQDEIEQALKSSPDSRYLLDLLRRTHARRLDVARLQVQVG